MCDLVYGLYFVLFRHRDCGTLHCHVVTHIRQKPTTVHCTADAPITIQAERETLREPSVLHLWSAQ